MCRFAIKLTWPDGFDYSDRGDLTDHDLGFPATASTGPSTLAYDFTYNGVSQMLSRAISDPTYNWIPPTEGTDDYAVNGLNQYTGINGASPTYDGNGNMTSDISGRSFTYDAENVLRTATGLASGGSAVYRYYADGSRREKSHGGVSSQFYYMGGLGYLDEEDTQFAADQEIAEYDGNTLLRRYVRLPGSVDEAFLMIDLTLQTNDNERWAHMDRLGSVVAMSDTSGEVLEQYRYSPYGVPGWEGPAGFPFRFTGQKLDPETGLYYYKARYYDPELGRFLQTDPIGYEDQMNLYAYVGNDPVNRIDPSGEYAEIKIDKKNKTIEILIPVKFEGDEVSDSEKQGITSDIEDKLSVTIDDESSEFNGYTVTTTVEERNSGRTNTITINDNSNERSEAEVGGTNAWLELNKNDRIGQAGHEFGHILGLKDLYKITVYGVEPLPGGRNNVMGPRGGKELKGSQIKTIVGCSCNRVER